MAQGNLREESVSARNTAAHAFQRPETDRAHVRGSLFGTVPQFVKSYFGDSRWPEFLDRLPPLARCVLELEIDALAWYPFAAISAAVDALVVMSDEPRQQQTLQRFAYHNLDRATNRIFKAIFKLGSPEFMVKKSNQMWAKYYNVGRMEALEAAPGRALVRLYGFPEMTPNYDQVVLYAIGATIMKAGGAMQTQDIVCSTCAGSEYGEYRYTWQK